MKKQRSLELRQMLAREAARLMYEEGVDQYFNAKHLAAKRLFGRGGHKKMRYRPQDLPSNSEIQAALREHVQQTEGKRCQQRLFAMRIIALETMQTLKRFNPRLIGSVSTGQVRHGSDIDLHVFTDNLEEIEADIHHLGWSFKTRQVTTHIGGHYKDYTHIYFKQVFPIELSVYPDEELRITRRSSTDGKPIVRVNLLALEKLIAEEHHREWELYQATGEITALDQFKNEV